jgi:hypothetical protein
MGVASEVTDFDRPTKQAEGRGIDLLEEVERTKMSGDVKK